MDRINVSIRFRPLNQREKGSNSSYHNEESWLINDVDSSVIQTAFVDGSRVNIGPVFAFGMLVLMI